MSSQHCSNIFTGERTRWAVVWLDERSLMLQKAPEEGQLAEA